MSRFRSGMPGFTLIWLGPVISLLGSAMTWFSFTIWAWKETGQASALSTLSFFAFLPTLLLAPLAGALVDRWNRKLVMALSDMATALGTLAALLLYLGGGLQIWHVYLIGLLAGFFTAFQFPAYSVAVTAMLDKDEYARAEGMLGIAQAASTIFAPPLAAFLLGRLGMAGIMMIDLFTFLAAFASLLWVKIPQPPATRAGLESRGSLWQESGFGFRYIASRPGLAGLVTLSMFANLFLGMGATLMAPLVLSWNQNSESAWATVQALGAVGGLVGGSILSLWGGPSKRIHGILLGGVGACLAGMLGLGLARAMFFWALASFFFAFFEPFVEGGGLALWQVKVESDIQGKVLAARQLISQVPYLLGTLASGYLVEYLVQPALGLGAAPAFSVTLSVCGLAGAAIFLSGYLFRPIRQVETLLPDQSRRAHIPTQEL